MIAATGSSSKIVYESLPVNDPKQRRPDIDKARALLDWEPTIGLAVGLRLLLENSRRVDLVGRVVGA